MKFWNGIGAAAAAIGLSLVAVGQTAPATCKTAPASVTALNIERAVPLATILTTITPNASPATLAALAGGALEVREQLIYNPQTNQITSTVFLVATGSPLPSPFGTVTAANLVTITTVTLSQILTSCSPVPSLMFTGSVSGSTPSSIGYLYGASLLGASWSLSTGYTTDSPAKINNVTETIAGVVTLYSVAATGTLTVPTTTTPGGGGGTTGPTIVVKFANGTVALPNTNQQSPVNNFFLDATGSSSTGGALTFAWSTTSGSPVAFVGTGVPGQIAVQFPGPGDYVIQLKVTDAAGNSATFTLTLTYTGRPG